jgi:hypothetical protein
MAYQAGFRIRAQLEGGPCAVLECGRHCGFRRLIKSGVALQRGPHRGSPDGVLAPIAALQTCGSAARCAESLWLSGTLFKEVRGEAQPRRVIQRSRVPVRQSLTALLLQQSRKMSNGQFSLTVAARSNAGISGSVICSSEVSVCSRFWNAA